MARSTVSPRASRSPVRDRRVCGTDGHAVAPHVMKVWLDDLRPAPDGWVGVLWPDEAVKLLKTGTVTELSLDHDLGNDNIGTGYDVLLWLEEQVATQGFVPPAVITIHSANPAGRRHMQQAIDRIRKFQEGL